MTEPTDWQALAIRAMERVCALIVVDGPVYEYFATNERSEWANLDALRETARAEYPAFAHLLFTTERPCPGHEAGREDA